MPEAPASNGARADRPPFLERYRRLFNRRGECWWSIVFGYPVARFLVAAIEDIRFITPIGLTVFGFAVKLAAAFAIYASTDSGGLYLVEAAVLLQLAQVLDSMDGTLARARGTSSRVGAFLDKVTDAVGLFAITAAVGWFALAVTGEPLYLLAAVTGGAAFIVLCYQYWVARSLLPSASASSISGESPALSWQGAAREWLLGWWRIILVQEADLYFWIALLLLTGHVEALCLLVLISQAGAAVLRFAMHIRSLTRQSAETRP